MPELPASFGCEKSGHSVSRLSSNLEGGQHASDSWNRAGHSSPGCPAFCWVEKMSVSRAKRRAVIETYGLRCWLCREMTDLELKPPEARAFTVDHVIPKAHYGRDNLENLRPAHFSCNQARGHTYHRRGLNIF